jgi:hypothetical protein
MRKNGGDHQHRRRPNDQAPVRESPRPNPLVRVAAIDRGTVREPRKEADEVDDHSVQQQVTGRDIHRSKPPCQLAILKAAEPTRDVRRSLIAIIFGMAHQPAETRRSNFGRWLTLGWFVVAFHAVIFAAHVYFHWLPFWPKILVICFCFLAVVGCLCKWGPTILLSFAGFYFGAIYFRAYPYTHDDWEVMMEDIGFPILFAFTGLLIGAAIELARARSNTGQIGQSADWRGELNGTG